MQRPRTIITLSTVALVLALLSISLMATVPTSPALAIGEVTPTPTSAPTMTFDEYLENGITALQNRELQVAVDMFSQALLIQPDADAYFLRAFAYAELGNSAAAIDDYTRSLELRHWDWTALNNRGFTYQTLGDDENALADYNETVFRNPRYEFAFINLTDLYESQGLDAEASITNWIASGLERRNFSDLQTAEEYFTNAINEIEALDGSSLSSQVMAAAYYNRALLYMDSPTTAEDALDDYTQCLVIMPTMHDCLLGRGIAYRESGDVERAGEDFWLRMEIINTETFELDALTLGDSTEVQMEYGYIYLIPFEALSGDNISVLVEDLEGVGVDPLLVILDPNGEPIAGDDDFGGFFDSQIEDFVIPSNGTYTLAISHANARFDGLVRISLNSYTPGV